MASDLSEKIKEINSHQPSIAAELNSPSPEVTEVAKELDKKVDELKAQTVTLPYIETPKNDIKKIIKNDWQQPAMFYVDFLMRASIMVCAIVVVCYFLRLMFWS